MRRLLLLLLLPLCLAVGGCGGGGDVSDQAQQLKERAEQARTDVQRRAEEVGQRIRERRKKLITRIEAVLGDLRQTIPRAQETKPAVQRRPQEQTVSDFLTGVLQNIDGYWTKTLQAAGRPAPRVAYSWIPRGGRQQTGCGTVADDRAAFYCPNDDTIYFAQEFAAELYSGVVRGLPGGDGGAAGSFGVAYVLAHEYGHNIQNELGVFRITRTNTAEPFELQADCLAGSWGNSAFAKGGLTDEDLRQAIATVESVGDYDFSSAQHHGTPAQRRDAWLTGFRGGDPSACTRYLPTGSQGQ